MPTDSNEIGRNMKVAVCTFLLIGGLVGGWGLRAACGSPAVSAPVKCAQQLKPVRDRLEGRK